MNFTIAAAQPTPQSAVLSPAAALEHRKLANAAQQFEGMLLEEMLKPMKQHGFGQEDGQKDSDDPDAGSGFADTLSSFGTETMATAIAKAGGLGIASRVVKQVEGEKTSHRHELPQTQSSEFQNKTATVLKSAAPAPIS